LTRPDHHSAPVDVVGELGLRSPGGVEFQIRGRGEAIELVALRLRDLLVIKNVMAGSGFRSGLIRTQKLGRHSDVTLKIRVGSAEIIRLSPNSGGNWLAAILGVAPAEVRLGGLFRALMP
jgi:hypothetical protein